MLNNPYFPLAFMSNSLAMTALLIVVGLAGLSELASDIAITQGITLALLSSLSANARNLILNHVNPIKASQLLWYRLILLLPLIAIAYWLSLISDVNPQLAFILLLRKSIEWLDEIFLSEMERLNQSKKALYYLIMQSFLLIVALIWMLAKMPFPLLGLLIWAFLPLTLSGKFYLQIGKSTSNITLDLFKKIYPHIGSTAIIGITVYVFRLVMIDLLGKPTAGDLFVAFAIGGVLGSVVANAFGPSMVFAQKASRAYAFPRGLKLLTIVFLISGISIIIFSPVISLLDKSRFFWTAVGLSMIGAIPMISAQLTRHRLLQGHHDHDLFGPDVLMNVILVGLIPLVYYLLGIEFITSMYLLSSIMAWGFYRSYEAYESGHSANWIKTFKYIKPILACLLILPIFFLLNSGIFTDPDPLFNTHRKISQLPLPLSVLANFGILLGIGAFSRARISFTFIFFCFALITISTIVSVPANSYTQQMKFVQMAQFILPMFALITGQFFESGGRQILCTFEKIFFYAIFFVVSLQIISTWLQGSQSLIPSVYVFSIYQYLHYVPVMLIVSYMFIFERLWQESSRPKLLLLWLLLAIYSILSGSFFVVFTFLMSLIAYIIFFGKFRTHKNLKLFFTSIALIVVTLTWQPSRNGNDQSISDSSHIQSDKQVSTLFKAQYNLEQKLSNWTSNLALITYNSQTLWVGFTKTSDHPQSGKPHNYYIDFLYNFGLIGITPILLLIAFTFYQVFIKFQSIMNNTSLLFPLLSLSFLLLVENSFYPGLKQPYSGTLSFFLWGIFLSRLISTVKKA